MSGPSDGSATAVVEEIELDKSATQRPQPAIDTNKDFTSSSGGIQDAISHTYQQVVQAEGDKKYGIETLPSPITAATEELERWNHPRLNIYRVLSTFWQFFVMGANDATSGAIIVYLESYYHLSYLVVSLIFLSPVVGYNLASVLNNTIHLRLGQRGIAFLTPTFHLASYIITACHPPFPVLVVAFIFAGCGNGLADSAWNAWIGNMASANELLGMLHAAYGLGALVAPLVATAMIARAGLLWYYWIYCMIGFATLELVTSMSTFWTATGAVFRAAHPRTTNAGGSRLKEAVAARPAARITWLAALFLLCYVGVEVALGGWIVVFMIRERNASNFAGGMTATGFWLGLTIGRLVLGFVTPRIGERLAVAIYLPVSIGLELLFWLVPQFYVGAVAVALVGFFLGPIFPSAIVACTRLLPKHLHVSSIGFSAAFGGSGAAVFPFAVGAIAQAKGVQVLQPIVIALLVVALLLWLALPRMPKKHD